MKIQEVTNNDISIGIQSEQSFKLNQDSGILYDILRSKMYREPIPSIVREISSNARDANREAGKGDIPIEVYFSNADDDVNYLFDVNSASINFKDCGLGMTPDRISDIYLTYGASDKRNDNTMTGGWGLGCKTPFALSDFFSVTTVCDYKGLRKKYTYLASIDKTNKGKFSLLDECITTEDTGTTVSMPIEKSNINKFKDACNLYFKYWDNQIEGYEFRPTIYSDKDINIYENKTDLKVFLIIDGIYYPLQEHKNINLLHFKEIGLKIDLALKFNTGDLMVQPSREDVRYTDETITAINNKLNNLNLNDFLKNIFSNVNIDNNTFELKILSRYINFVNCPQLKNIINIHNINKSNYINGLNVYKKTYYSSSIILCNLRAKDLIEEIRNKNTLVILTQDKFKYKKNILTKIKQSHFCVLKENFRQEDADLVNHVINLFGTNVIYDYDVAYTPVKRVYNSSGYKGLSFRYLENGIVTHCKDNPIIKPNSVIYDVDSIIEIEKNTFEEKYRKLKYISKEQPIVIINKINRKKFSNFKLFNFKDYKDQLLQLKKNDKESTILQFIKDRFHNHATLYLLYDYLPKSFKKYIDSDFDSHFKDTWSYNLIKKEYRNRSYLREQNYYNELETIFNEIIKGKEDIIKLVNRYTEKKTIDKLKTIKYE